MEGHSLDDNLFPELDPTHCFNGHLSPPQTSIITVDQQQQQQQHKQQHSHQIHQHQHDPNAQVKLYANSDNLAKSSPSPNQPFHSIQVIVLVLSLLCLEPIFSLTFSLRTLYFRLCVCCFLRLLSIKCESLDVCMGFILTFVGYAGTPFPLS